MSRPPATPDQIKELERIVSRQPGSRFFAPLAEAYLEQGRATQAAEVAKRGLDENPGFTRGLSVYARALYLSGRREDAMRAYTEACAQNPKESALRADWGAMLAAAGDHGGARDAFEDALRINPLDFEAHHALEKLPERTHPGDDLVVEDDETTAARYDDVPTEVAPERSSPIDTDPTKVQPPAPGEAHEVAQIRNLPVRRTKSGSIPFMPAAPPMPPPASAPAPATTAEFEAQPTNVVPPPPAVAAKPAAAVKASKAIAAQQARRARRAASARKSARMADAQFETTDRSERIPVPSRTGLYTAVAIAVVVLGVLVVWLRMRGRDAQHALAAAHELLLSDTADSLEEAEHELERAAAAHSGDARLQSALATVAATRWYRFGHEAEKQRAAAASAEAARAGANLGERALPEALLRLGAGDAAAAAELAQAGAQAAPADPRARLALGLVAAARGQLPLAEEALATAVAYERGWMWPAVELARVQRRRGRIEAARATIAEALLRQPRHVAARVEKLAIEVAAGNSPDELDLSQLDKDTAGTPPLAAELLALRGRVAVSRAQSDAARTLFAQAQKLRPFDPEYAWLFGRAELLPGGDVARAVAALESTRAPDAALDLAEAELRAGRAQAALTALDGGSSERQAQLELAAHIDLDDLAQVDKRCQSPGDDETLLTCSEALLARGQSGRAVRLLGKVARPDLRGYAEGLRRFADGSPSDAVELLAGERARRVRARAQAAIGHFEAALDTLAQGERESAGAWRDRAAHAELLAELGDTDGARKVAELALAAHPDAPEAIGALAEALPPDDGLRLVETALRTHPNAPRLHEAHGRLALAKGDAATAEKAFTAALAANPASPRANAGLVEAALAEGDRGRAGAATKQALQVSPDAAFAAALALAKGGEVDAAAALVDRAARALSGPSVASRVRLGELEVARLGLAQTDARARRHARRILEKLAAGPDAAPYAVYLWGRLVERDHGTTRALPLYRQALERDPGLSDAALRVGLALCADGRSQEDGVSLLRQYLQKVRDGEGADRARKELARLGR